MTAPGGKGAQRGGARPHTAEAPENEGDIPPATDTPAGQSGAAGEIGDTGGAGDDPGPAEPPFTGLQLALMAMIGLATAASGSVLRRAT